ncbi:MAG TPA: hypothetical protein VGE66_07570 [Chitinophagaceae bacterium]
MRPVFVIAIVATLFTACKNNKKGAETTDTGSPTTTTTNTTTPTTGQAWDEPTKAAFVANCTNEAKARMNEDAAKEYCNCMLDKIVARYSSPAEANTMTIQETQDMAKECVK